MKRILKWIAGLGLIVIATLMLGLFSQIENWKRDLSVNHASLDAASDDPRMHPPVVEDSPSEVVDRIVTWAEQAPLWSVESKDVGDRESAIHLTRTTKVFRWVDDIHVRISATENGTRIDAESQSRVGKGDLGQNPRNLRDLVAAVRSTNSQ